MTKWQKRKYDKFKNASLFYRSFLKDRAISGDFWRNFKFFCVII